MERQARGAGAAYTWPSSATAHVIERFRGRPAVLVLDLQLPGISGIEVCRFLRSRFDETALPVLMLTVYGHKSDLIEGLGAGANDYLTKPYDAPELMARVSTLARINLLFEAARRAEASGRSCSIASARRAVRPRPPTPPRTSSWPWSRTSCAPRSTPSSAGRACCAPATSGPISSSARWPPSSATPWRRPSSSRTCSTWRASAAAVVHRQTRRWRWSRASTSALTRAARAGGAQAYPVERLHSTARCSLRRALNMLCVTLSNATISSKWGASSWPGGARRLELSGSDRVGHRAGRLPRSLRALRQARTAQARDACSGSAGIVQSRRVHGGSVSRRARARARATFRCLAALPELFGLHLVPAHPPGPWPRPPPRALTCLRVLVGATTPRSGVIAPCSSRCSRFRRASAEPRWPEPSGPRLPSRTWHA